LEYVVRLEPADNLLNIRPDPPAHGEGDHKAQQLVAVGLFGGMIAVDGNDANYMGLQVRTIPRLAQQIQLEYIP
jgi:hypothetical protein